MRHALALALLISAACGGSSPKPAAAPPPPAAGPSCGQVADHLMLLLAAEAKAAPQDAIDNIRIELIKACDDTQWSAAARRCVMEATVGPDTNRCEPLFTEAQRQAFGPGPEPKAPLAAPPEPPRDDVPDAVDNPFSRGNPGPRGPVQHPATKSTSKKAKGKGADSDPCDGGE